MSTQQRNTGIKVGAVASMLAIGTLLAALVLSSAASGLPDESAAAARTDGAGIGHRPVQRLSRKVDGVRLSFSVPAAWETNVDPEISINRSTHGPQGAEAIIFFTSFPDGDHADPCRKLLPRSKIGSSTAALAAAVARAPGTEVVKAPMDVTVGGRSAKRIALWVRKDAGCDPGYFYTWDATFGGAFWLEANVGDTIAVWVVEVHGVRLFIEAETTNDSGAGVLREIQQIVKSIRFGST